MTTPEQDKIIAALAEQHGAVKVLPLRGTRAVIACGWQQTTVGPGHAIEPWWYVGERPDDLRYAYEQEIADALEQEAVRGLLAAAGLG